MVFAGGGGHYYAGVSVGPPAPLAAAGLGNAVLGGIGHIWLIPGSRRVGKDMAMLVGVPAAAGNTVAAACTALSRSETRWVFLVPPQFLKLRTFAAQFGQCPFGNHAALFEDVNVIERVQ